MLHECYENTAYHSTLLAYCIPQYVSTFSAALVRDKKQLCSKKKHNIIIQNFIAYKIQACFHLQISSMYLDDTYDWTAQIWHIQCTGWSILTKHTEIRTHRGNTWGKHTVRRDRGCIDGGCCFPSRPSLNQRRLVYVLQSYDVCLPICRWNTSYRASIFIAYTIEVTINLPCVIRTLTDAIDADTRRVARGAGCKNGTPTDYRR